MDRVAWWATVHRITKSQTPLSHTHTHTHTHTQTHTDTHTNDVSKVAMVHRGRGL